MLDWVAQYVTEINTLDVKTGEKVELISADEDDMIITTRRGKTVIEAFRKCVKDAMREMPNDPAQARGRQPRASNL
jgi:hypothetical protein